MSTGIELAYLAGIIDADGYVTATRSVRQGRVYYGAQIGITGSRREPHDLAARIFGGNISAHQPGAEKSHHLTQFHWQRSGSKATGIIQAVLPYLRIKRVRAQLVIELQDALDERRELLKADIDPFPWALPDFDPNQMFDAMVSDVRDSSRGISWDEYPAAVSA